MNLKQRPEYIVSLFAAVAVNLAAYWWYQRTQKQLENGNGKDDDNEKPKQASKTPKKIGQTWNARKGVTVTPRVNMATVKKPRSAYTHRKYTMDDDKSVNSALAMRFAKSAKKDYNKSSSYQSSRSHTKPTTPLIKSKKRKSPKRTPRVRESLLPWNQNQRRNNFSPPKRAINYFDNEEDEQPPKTKTSTVRNVKAPRVRESLLPWNTSGKKLAPLYQPDIEEEKDDSDSLDYSEEESPQKRPTRAPKVRQSLLPWNRPEPSATTVESIGDEEPEEDLPSFPMEENILETSNAENHPVANSRDSLLSVTWNLEEEEEEGDNDEDDSPLSLLPSDEDLEKMTFLRPDSISTLNESESPLANDSNGKSQMTSRSPLMDSTNQKKTTRAKAKDFRKKEISPTLARLSLGGGESDVRARRQQFEEWEGPAVSY